MTTETTTNPDQPPLRRLRRVVRQRDLPAVTGLQKTQIAEEMRLGNFPQSFPLTAAGRAVGWWEDELIDWQTKRLAKRG